MLSGGQAGVSTPYAFVAHPVDERHPQWDGGEMHYGDTVVTLDYVRERWAPRSLGMMQNAQGRSHPSAILT